jgi:SulP family sulfate permease
MDADLDFATATALERYAADALQQAPQARDLALLMQSINSIDITGVETFARLERLVALRGGLLHVVGLKLPAEQRLERAGLLHKKAAPSGSIARMPTFCERLAISPQNWPDQR